MQESTVVGIRLPSEYKKYIEENNIDIKQIVIDALEQKQRQLRFYQLGEGSLIIGLGLLFILLSPITLFMGRLATLYSIGMFVLAGFVMILLGFTTIVGRR